MPHDSQAAPTEPVIALNAVSKVYQMADETFHALKDISFSINHNEYVAITGPSGSGKSTLLNILGCLDKPSSGEYIVSGTNASTLPDSRLARLRNRDIGFIFQSFNLLPKLSALENVMQPLVYRAIGLSQRKEMARVLLERVGLSHRENHLPNQLSGGQRQRVAIARALVTRPSILLADEPTGNLDSSTTLEIMALFDELHKEDGHTILLVTHEQEIAEHCSRIIRVKDGEIASDVANEAKKIELHSTVM